LQVKIIDLFNRSLVDLGYLCLGLHEFIPPSKSWQVVDLSTKLYRKGQNG
jgi:chemotaxis methyl-accepting protein methylase